MLSPEQIEAYFDRIGLPDETRRALKSVIKEETDIEAITILQKCHMSAIPFENLMFYYTKTMKPPSFEIEDLFEQMITRKRGHICDATNLLFAELMRSLGYSVYCTTMRRNNPVAGLLRPVNGDQSLIQYGPWEHGLVILELGSKKYAINVTPTEFGTPVPNELTHNKPYPDVGGRMKRMFHSALPGFHPSQKWWRMQVREIAEELWKDVQCFQEVEWNAYDLALLARGMWETGQTWMSALPICVRYTMEDGVPTSCLMILGKELKQWDLKENKKWILQKFYCESERVDALKEHFGIVLSPEQQQGIVGRHAAIPDDFDYYQCSV